MSAVATLNVRPRLLVFKANTVAEALGEQVEATSFSDVLSGSRSVGFFVANGTQWKRLCLDAHKARGPSEVLVTLPLPDACFSLCIKKTLRLSGTV